MWTPPPTATHQTTRYAAARRGEKGGGGLAATQNPDSCGVWSKEVRVGSGGLEGGGKKLAVRCVCVCDTYSPYSHACMHDCILLQV
jgi:hypothetical protein